MAQSPVISTLIDKRADLARTVSGLERDLQQARTDLAHLDATIRMFDATIQPFTIKAKNAAPSRSAHFDTGEIGRRCHEALRKAGASGVTAAYGNQGFDYQQAQPRDYRGDIPPGNNCGAGTGRSSA